MLIHLLWIINQSGQLIAKLGFTDPQRTGELGRNPESQLTLSSVLFSTYGMSQELTPNENPVDCVGMTLIEMEEHNIHVHETPTAVKFVLITDSASVSIPTALWQELHLLYTNHAMKNPFHVVDEGGIGQPIRIAAFSDAVRRTINKYSPPVVPPAGAAGSGTTKRMTREKGWVGQCVSV
eukprot:gene1527-912_t